MDAVDSTLRRGTRAESQTAESKGEHNQTTAALKDGKTPKNGLTRALSRFKILPMKQMPFATILIIALWTLPASASVVTFDGLSSGCAPASTGGLDFSGPYCSGTWNGNPNGNGTTGFIFNDLGGSGSVLITRTGGGAFDLNSFEMGISWYSAATSTTVLLTANFDGGGSASQTLSLVNSLQLYSLNLSNLSSVQISEMAANDGYWLLDNVVYDEIPEPSTFVLGASALALFALGIRRRQV
jgi:hypothetical protein